MKQIDLDPKDYAEIKPIPVWLIFAHLAIAGIYIAACLYGYSIAVWGAAFFSFAAGYAFMGANPRFHLRPRD